MTPREYFQKNLDNWCTVCQAAGHKTADCPIGYQAVPRERWPIWANAIALWKAEEDKGIGDTVSRSLGTAGEVFKTVLKRLGINCGCDDRRDEWNALFPYRL